MNYLLDTCAYIYLLVQPERFSSQTRALLLDRKNTIFVSAVSANEIAIKRSQGKLTLKCDDFNEVEARGLKHLPFCYEHGKQVESLPYHHRDPFDRMLISQAFCEQLTIITSDSEFKKYPILVQKI